EVNAFMREVFADITNWATDSAARLRRIVALEAMRNLSPQAFHGYFPQILDEYINSESQFKWRMLLAVARRSQWIVTYLGILNTNKAIAAVTAADIESSSDVKMILDALYLDGF